MVNALTETGRQGFLDGSIDFDGATNMSVAILDFNTASAAIIQVTSSTSATPPVMLTATTHGLSTGDLVYINGHTTNTACNGFWKITVVDTTHFSLQNPISGTNVVGTGGAGAGGYAITYGGVSTVGKFYTDWSASQIYGANGKVNLASRTVLNGVADAADVTFSTIATAAAIDGILILQDTGTAGTSQIIGVVDGFHIVTCDSSPGASTTIVVEPLTAAIPNTTVLRFSDGASATLSSLANVGDRSLTVASTTVTAGSRALAPATGSGLPVTPNGGNIVVSWDNTAGRGIFKL